MIETLAAAAGGAFVFWGSRSAFGAFHPRSQHFGPVQFRLPGRGQTVLTFDDGPHPHATPRVLDILAEFDAPATFFVIGRFVDEHPRLVRRIAEAGHQIGNHTYDHSRLGLFGQRRYWEGQIERTQSAITNACGLRPTVFRPPMGFTSRPILRCAAEAGCCTFAWSRRARDGVASTPEKIMSRLESTVDGDILLMHDGVEPASDRDPSALLDALPRVIGRIRELGLRPVRLDRGATPPSKSDATDESAAAPDQHIDRDREGRP